MNRKRLLQYCILLLSTGVSQPLCAKEVGQIQYTYGAVIMQNMDGSGARLIAKETLLQRGDVVKTGPRSFSIVRLNDGTHMTIRPNSSFSVERFNPEIQTTSSTVLRLYRGGMRVSSGYIGDKKSGSYTLKTEIAVLGVHAATFDVRLCRDDCDAENKMHKNAQDKTLNDEVVESGLYVSTTRGKVSLTNKEDATLDIGAGQSVYTDVLGRQNKRLPVAPMFQLFDVYPVPDMYSSSAENFNIKAIGGENAGIVCEIQ